MAEDIGQILQKWPYDPENSIRKIIDLDGIERIQVRVDQGAFQGVLQMELDGRPDGKRPYDCRFALDYRKGILQRHIADIETDKGYSLSKKACQELFDESRRLYERYVFLLQIQDYDRVIRDTERNMAMFRFINRYAKHHEDKMNLEKWWPYVLRIHAVARVMIAAQDEDYDSALEIISDVKEKIDALEEVDAEEFRIEKKRSLQALDELAGELSGKRPLSTSEQLQMELDEAVEQEEFERAAQLRDKIRQLDQE